MKKRIISFALAVVMLFSMAVTAGAQETKEVSNVYAEELLIGLGILDSATYNPQSVLTRGEFATLISKVILYGQDISGDAWYDSTFGPDASPDSLPDAPLFNDVDASHSQFAGIRTVVSQGYMRGIGESIFAPDFRMTLSEAVKVIVSMLGYDEIALALGGYPNGYMQVATKCKLLGGISQSYNEVVTLRSAVSLIANALDVELKKALEISDGELVYKDGGETFLNFFLKLEKAEGRMTDNGITSLTGANSSVGSEQMIVAGKHLKHSSTSYIYTGYIGREVTAYYSIDSATKDVCVYICPEDNAEVITEGTAFKGGTLTYTVNGKNKTAEISRNSVVIYNGIYTDSYPDSLLCVDNGTVTLIKGDRGAYTVVVQDYRDVLVTNVSYDSKKVYNQLKFADLKDGSSVLSLEEGTDYSLVRIFDETGKSATIDDIVKGDVLSVMASADGKRYLEVRKCSAEPLELELNSYTAEEFITAQNTYEFGVSYLKSTNKTAVTPGETYKVYVNDFGKIVWISKGASPVGKVAIFTGIKQVGTSGLSDEYALRLFTENKELKVFNLPEKINVNGERVDSSEAEALLGAFMGKAVLFDATEEGVLTDIITPAAFGETGVKDWYHVSPGLKMFDGNEGVASFKTQYYEPGDGASFGGNFAYNSSTRLVFTVPTSEDDFDNEKKFLINNPLSSSTSYTVEAYSTIKNDPVPEVLIIYSDAKGSGTVKRNRGLLITKVVNTVDEDGEEVTAFKGYEIMQNSLKEVTLPVTEDVIMTKVKEDYTVTLLPIEPGVDTDVAKYGPLSYTDLEPGDIIRYGTDSENRINVIRIAFDYSQMKGYDEALHVAWASFAGPVLNVNSKGLKLAYGIKPEDIDYTDAADVKKIKGFAFGGSKYPLVFVQKDARGLSFREGTYEDITSYEMTGDSAVCDFACILTHFTGGRMGGVIYVK